MSFGNCFPESWPGLIPALVEMIGCLVVAPKKQPILTMSIQKKRGTFIHSPLGKNSSQLKGNASETEVRTDGAYCFISFARDQIVTHFYFTKEKAQVEK
ncbi:MAG TPA: hypothetical protein PLU80_17565, partial [Acidobacteriota bacterium]|nr:hypothetical protein [Acidobacteriota bacterium]